MYLDRVMRTYGSARLTSSAVRRVIDAYLRVFVLEHQFGTNASTSLAVGAFVLFYYRNKHLIVLP